MQIIVLIAVSLVVAALIIYKINKKFEAKELIILLVVVIIPILIGTYLLDNKNNEVPNKFKTKYENVKNVKILKLSFERLNNKNVSSKTNFVYDFTYIVKKDNKELFCNAKGVKIKKIQDEFIFEDFEKLNEECKNK